MTILLTILFIYWFLVGTIFLASDFLYEDFKEEDIIYKILFNYGVVPFMLIKEILEYLFPEKEGRMNPCMAIVLVISICIALIIYVKKG